MVFQGNRIFLPRIFVRLKRSNYNVIHTNLLMEKIAELLVKGLRAVKLLAHHGAFFTLFRRAFYSVNLRDSIFYFPDIKQVV